MKVWTIIENEKQYEKVMNRIEELSINPPSPKSDAGKELLLLGYLAEKYESEQFPIDYPDPIDAIKVRMEELGLGPEDLLSAFGDKGTASKVLNRKRPMSIKMIRELSQRLTLPEGLLLKPVKMKTKSRSGKVLVK